MIRISDVKQVGGGAAKQAVAKPNAVAEEAIAVVADDAPVAALLNDIITDAVRATATAVHIEPHGKDVVVRYRVDGLLREGKAVSADMLETLCGRVKFLANLDVDESRVPQDGRFEITANDKKYVVRATLLPVADGEKIVLHITDQSSAPRDLEKLGFWGRSLHTLADAAEQTHGLVIVGGPAGSGKTATLYGLLHIAADPSRNIATVEDPIEHRIPGINQTPVNTKVGMTFGDTLRAVLHQDPNVVMVSELSEPETVGQSLQAALAGRLVFAGMHSRDVAATIAHVIAMHAEPYLVAAAVRAVANQRLVRRLCQECREHYKPAAGEFTSACTSLGIHPEGAVTHIATLQQAAAVDLGVADGANPTSRLWRAKPGGCSHCGGSGYKGRIVLAEAIAISPALQKLVFSNASGAAIYDQAIDEGMIPLPLDGLVKAALGLTSLDEVMRAASE